MRACVCMPVNVFFELRLIELFTLSASSFFCSAGMARLRGVCGRNFLVPFCNKLRFLVHPTNRLIKLIRFDRGCVQEIVAID